MRIFHIAWNTPKKLHFCDIRIIHMYEYVINCYNFVDMKL